MNLAKAQLDDEIDFAPLIKIKRVRNKRGMLLPTLGWKKLSRLVELGVKNAKALLEFQDTEGMLRDTSSRSPLDSWKEIAQAEYDKRAAVLNQAKDDFLQAQREHRFAVCRMKAQQAIDNDGLGNDTAALPGEEEQLPDLTLTPKFSAMDDPMGYNAMFLSTDRIDAILAAEHHHRKPVQLGEMYGLPAKILKIDFNYKIAKKVRVWNGRGISFRPYIDECKPSVYQGFCPFVWPVSLKGA